MSQLSHVVIVLARCGFTRQDFGIRFEEQRLDQWIADWAYRLPGHTAQHEGDDRSEITGTFGFAPAYPGCPFCQAKGIARCTCGKVACWDGTQPTMICPWCWATQTLEGPLRHLNAGADR